MTRNLPDPQDLGMDMARDLNFDECLIYLRHKDPMRPPIKAIVLTQMEELRLAGNSRYHTITEERDALEKENSKMKGDITTLEDVIRTTRYAYAADVKRMDILLRKSMRTAARFTKVVHDLSNSESATIRVAISFALLDEIAGDDEARAKEDHDACSELGHSVEDLIRNMERGRPIRLSNIAGWSQT